VGADTSNYIDTTGVTCENITATGTLTLSSGLVRSAVVTTDAATYTVLAANSGKTHIVPNLTADCVFTLPTPAAGLHYRFIYGGGAADAQDWTLNTGSDTNYFIGGLAGHDTTAVILYVFSDGNSNSKVKIDTPNIGTAVELYCDGTNWYISGTVHSSTDTHSVFSDQ